MFKITFVLFSIALTASVQIHAAETKVNELNADIPLLSNTPQNSKIQNTEIQSSETIANLAQVKKIQGRVLYHKAGALRGEKAAEGLKLFNNDMVRTKRDAEAIVHLIDGSTLFITASSTLRLLDNNQLAVDSGKVLFDIKKRDASQGLKIATKTAVIGVKGTRFLVSASGEDVQVFLQEGKVNVEAVDAPFKEYKAQQAQEFDAFKQEFKDYVKNIKEEFASYVSDLDMSAGQAISVNDNVLTRHDIDVETQALFDRFEAELMSSD